MKTKNIAFTVFVCWCSLFCYLVNFGAGDNLLLFLFGTVYLAAKTLFLIGIERE